MNPKAYKAGWGGTAGRKSSARALIVVVLATLMFAGVAVAKITSSPSASPDPSAAASGWWRRTARPVLGALGATVFAVDTRAGSSF